MVIMLLSNHRNVRSGFLDDRIFSLMCLLTLFLCLFETVTFCVDGRLFWGAIPLARISNALLFALNAVFSFLWTVYVDYKLFGDLRRLRQVYPYVAIPAGARVRDGRRQLVCQRILRHLAGECLFPDAAGCFGLHRDLRLSAIRSGYGRPIPPPAG